MIQVNQDAGPWWTVQYGPGPVVATAIHDGHDLRPEIAARMALAEDDRLREGDPVVVERVQGLTLSVRRAEEWELET